MTAAASRAVSSSLPGTQATAPVLSFTCLYTRDSHKKAKRWHDGIVKYHTFNKRVMVYEESNSGTFVGDMHWRGDEDIQEGDELRLERGGIVVDVGESRGTENADLSQLRQAKKSGPTATDAGRATSGTTGQSRVPMQNGTKAELGGKHRSLNALLGTPKGRLGKATLPTKSPFEERHAVDNSENLEWENGRPPKRARTEVTTPEWSVSRTSKASAGDKRDETPLWARTADSAKKEKKQRKKHSLQPGQRKLGQKVVIDLEDDVSASNNFLPGLSDGLLAPSSPARQSTVTANRGSTNQDGQRSSSPVMQRSIAMPAQRKCVESSERRSNSRDAIVRSPRSIDTSDLSGPSLANDARDSRRASSPKLSRAASLTTGQTLRFAASAPKKRTLLCQDQLTTKSKRICSTNTDDAADSLLGSMDIDDEPQQPKTAEERLAARLKRIEQKKGSTSASRLRAPVVIQKVRQAVVVLDDDDDQMQNPSDESSDTIVGEVPQRRLTTLETSAIELARLDQMMLPPPAPRAPPAPLAVSAEQKLPQTRQPSPAKTRPATATAAAPIDREMSAQTPSAPPPSREKICLRRVVSESGQPQFESRRVPGAPVRYTPTPSPTKRSREPTPAAIGSAAAKPPVGHTEPHLATLADAPSGPKATSAKALSALARAQPILPNKALPPPAPERSASFRNNKSRKPLQKSVSLNIASTGTSTVILNRPFHKPGRPVVPKEVDKEQVKDLGPWSREAFDLFAEKWRPPGWNEEKWRAHDKENDPKTTVTS